MVLFFAVYASGFAALFIFQTIHMHSLEARISEEEKAVDELSSQSQKSENSSSAKDSGSLEKIMNVVDNKIEWSKYLEIISTIPDRVWLNEIKLSKEKVLITGNYADTKDVVEFLEKLKKKHIFEEVVLRSTQVDKNKDQQEILTFAIEAIIHDERSDKKTK